MRFKLRIKINSFTFFMMLAKTQTLEGISSLQSDGSHIVMWDLEKCTLNEAEEDLRRVQKKYCLSHIFMFSDSEGSFRALCFSRVDYKTLLHILLDTEHLDPIFFDYTVKRKKATLRTDNKKCRPVQKPISVLWSYPASIPSDGFVSERVVYDTGLVKTGRSILLGDD